MKLLKFTYWKLVDLFRELKRIVKGQRKKPHLYGIYGFFGLPGKGKTMGLTYELEKIRRRYGEDVYITTNYFYKNQDFPFSGWEMLLKEYDKPLVVAWDEVQNEFTSRNFKSFPIELLTLLTQNRKGNGIRIMYSAQRYNRVDKVFRELTHQAVDCNTIFGRWTRLRYYHWEDYEELNNQTAVNLKMKIRPIRRLSFVQNDNVRDLYNSYKMLESAKSKDYITLEEVHAMKLNGV